MFTCFPLSLPPRYLLCLYTPIYISIFTPIDVYIHTYICLYIHLYMSIHTPIYIYVSKYTLIRHYAKGVPHHEPHTHSVPGSPLITAVINSCQSCHQFLSDPPPPNFAPIFIIDAHSSVMVKVMVKIHRQTDQLWL